MDKQLIGLWLMSGLLLGCAKPEMGREPLTVAIDIGHTLNHPGAVSARGKGEFLFNKNIAEQLLGELTARGFGGSFIINRDGGDIALTDRTRVAGEKRAGLFISIHHDSAQPRYLLTWKHGGSERFYVDSIRGYSLFYSGKNPRASESLAFAGFLGEELRRNGFSPTLHHAEKIEGENRPLVDAEKGIYRFDGLVVLKTAEMPAVLVECGVILNREEEQLLEHPVYQRMIVLSIADAVQEFSVKSAGK
ncbi:N-acetylmuramoyl-L-alanine amidase [Fibrobacterota bacterium]